MQNNLNMSIFHFVNFEQFSTPTLKMSRKYDIVVWGCTGFTGRLACEYIQATYPDLKWAIGGRSVTVMEELKKSLNLKSSVSILIGDINDSKSLRDIAAQTTVVLSTAGPYAKIGTPILSACVEMSTHYCDITGEVPWLRSVIDDFHADA